MALHETFTNNPDLAFVLGPGRPGFSGTAFGSLTIWGGQIIGFSAAGNPVVDVPVTGIPGITSVQAEVFGVRTYDATGLASVNVTMVEWSLPGSADILARYTFDAPVVFPLSILRFTGVLQFVDIVNELGSQQALFDDLFQGEDTLIGAGATDIMMGGGGNDMLDGGGGADQMDGGAGNDIFIFRSGDVVTGELVYGGLDIDSVLAIGAAVTGDLFQTGGVNLSSLNFGSLEQVFVNGTEVVLNAAQLGVGGFTTIFGQTGQRDQLTIGNMASGNLSTLSLVNWEAEDTIAVVGTTGADNVTGSAGQDIFLGLAGADSFSGGDGDDRFLILADDFTPVDALQGGAGNDVLQIDSTASFGSSPLSDLRGLVLSGIEVLDVVQGSFIMDGADFAGAITGSLAAPVITTLGVNRFVGNGTNAAPNDVLLEIRLDGLLGIDLRAAVFENWNDGLYQDHALRIVAGALTQVILGPSEAAWINGINAVNGISVQAGAQGDDIYGSNARDILYAGGGDDFAAGLIGNDVISAGEGQDTVWGGEGHDYVSADAGNDLVEGENGSDSLLGRDGNDTINGGGGIDHLWGGGGADALYGGADVDYARYDDASHGNLMIRLDNSALNTGAAAGDTYDWIEGLVGGAGNDTVVGNALTNYLLGSAGADLVYGGGGDDNLGGDAGGDHLWGGAGADGHYGGDGIDYARYDDANHGNLVIRLDAPGLNTGAAAGDSYDGIEGLVGGAGNDTVVGNAVTNSLFGSGGNDLVYGGGGNDQLFGDAGGDNLWGGTGADVHHGGDGIDYARYDDANHGNLTLRLDNAALNGGSAAVGDTYVGIEGLVGGAGADVIIGNTAANYLFGQGGADFIDGQGGNDHLNGGAGEDRFRFSTALSGSNIDHIADFQHLVDDILLLQSVFAGIGPALTADEFRIGMAQDANDRILYNNITGQLYYDSNANAAGGMMLFATVAAGTVLTFDDFVMV
jgi:Ca2+-binding RTX toxin-like protein